MIWAMKQTLSTSAVHINNQIHNQATGIVKVKSFSATTVENSAKTTSKEIQETIDNLRKEMEHNVLLIKTINPDKPGESAFNNPIENLLNVMTEVKFNNNAEWLNEVIEMATELVTEGYGKILIRYKIRVEEISSDPKPTTLAPVF